MNLRERLIVNKKLDDTENLKSGLIILFSLFITLIINEYSNIISETINELIHNITNITTISLAIVMLCATLSALTFTYYTTTDKNEKVKKNGQYYFISTILSMVLTVLIFLLTTFAPLITNLNVTHITLKSNIILSAYTFFIIITFILLIYTAYYLIIPSIKTLMILGFIKKESLTWKLIKKLIKIKKNNWWVTISIKHEK